MIEERFLVKIYKNKGDSKYYPTIKGLSWWATLYHILGEE